MQAIISLMTVTMLLLTTGNVHAHAGAADGVLHHIEHLFMNQAHLTWVVGAAFLVVLLGAHIVHHKPRF